MKLAQIFNPLELVLTPMNDVVKSFIMVRVRASLMYSTNDSIIHEAYHVMPSVYLGIHDSIQRPVSNSLSGNIHNFLDQDE